VADDPRVVHIQDAVRALPGPWKPQDGSVRIELEGKESVTLSAGDLFVVPAGTQHRPVADAVAHALLLERPQTAQYGN
jgi:uncharacterized protein YjlB